MVMFMNLCDSLTLFFYCVCVYVSVAKWHLFQFCRANGRALQITRHCLQWRFQFLCIFIAPFSSFGYFYFNPFFYRCSLPLCAIEAIVLRLLALCWSKHIYFYSTSSSSLCHLVYFLDSTNKTVNFNPHTLHLQSQLSNIIRTCIIRGKSVVTLAFSFRNSLLLFISSLFAWFYLSILTIYPAMLMALNVLNILCNLFVVQRSM